MEAERITGSPTARELVARYGTVEAVCINKLTPDECRVLEREYRKRGGTILTNMTGTEVLLMGPLHGLGELPTALREWGSATEQLGNELERLLYGRAHVPIPWTCSGESLSIGEDNLTLVHVPEGTMEHGQKCILTVEQCNGGEDCSSRMYGRTGVYLEASVPCTEEAIAKLLPEGEAFILFSSGKTPLPTRLEQYLARLDEMEAILGSVEQGVCIVWEEHTDPESELSRLGEFLAVGRPLGIRVHGAAEDAGETALIGALRGAAFVVIPGDDRNWSQWLLSHRKLLERWNHLA